MVWQPLGLFYLGSQLEAQGHLCEFFDLSMDELPEDGEFDQMWVSSTSPQIAEARRIGKITSKWTKTKTVLGGAGAWANPLSHEELGYDLVVVGEGDHPDYIREIVNIAQNSFVDKTAVSSRMYYTLPHKTLDWVLPPIRRWSLRYHSYMQGNRMTSIFTTRGCPMSCAFCESGRHGVIWDSMVRYEPLFIVEWQIKESKALGFQGLAYYDDIFILNKNRTRELLKLHRKYGMVFRCFLRSDILIKHGGKDYLKELQDGGLIEIFVGVESADNQIKNNIHKGTTIEQDTLVLQWCKELGITCKMSFILGLPGESMESMLKTAEWIFKNRPDRVQVDRLIPFPGTPLTDHAEDYDLTYETQPDEEFFFKGRMDLDSHSFVSTSNLSVNEIDQFWYVLERDLKRAGLSA
jgi:anaerobic magnesium-protoporphyrin IX monomethyl ester cyclase